jgi:hypothetical protein
VTMSTFLAGVYDTWSSDASPPPRSTVPVANQRQFE